MRIEMQALIIDGLIKLKGPDLAFLKKKKKKRFESFPPEQRSVHPSAIYCAGLITKFQKHEDDIDAAIAYVEQLGAQS